MTTTRVAERSPGFERNGVDQRVHPGRAVIIMMALGACLTGCDQLFGQDPARCEQSVATVRQAITFKDFALARKWRDYTWKVCDEKAVIATLDKELVDAEAAAAAEAEATAKQAAQLAQDRINAAQKLWRQFDAEPAANRTQKTLAATRKSAKRLESGLLPTYAQKLSAYNDGEYEKRLAALSR